MSALARALVLAWVQFTGPVQGTVDQIDGGTALVETHGGRRWVYIPVADLPNDVTEGDTICVPRKALRR